MTELQSPDTVTPTHPKRKQGGRTTLDLTLSAYVGNNDEIFPKILKLFVPEGSIVRRPRKSKGVSR